VKIFRKTDRIDLIAKKIINEETPKDYQAVSVNFQWEKKDVFTISDQLLQCLYKQIRLGVKLQNAPDQSWQGGRLSNTKCTDYFEKYLSQEIQTPLVLVLYNVELILEHQAIANNFFGLLRSWHNTAANNNSWKKLRLVIVHSKDIITDPPFNVGVVIEFREPEAGQ
jgi:hypothetical protein